MLKKFMTTEKNIMSAAEIEKNALYKRWSKIFNDAVYQVIEVNETYVVYIARHNPNSTFPMSKTRFLETFRELTVDETMSETGIF
jgi:hypothetical protein